MSSSADPNEDVDGSSQRKLDEHYRLMVSDQLEELPGSDDGSSEEGDDEMDNDGEDERAAADETTDSGCRGWILLPRPRGNGQRRPNRVGTTRDIITAVDAKTGLPTEPKHVAKGYGLQLGAILRDVVDVNETKLRTKKKHLQAQLLARLHARYEFPVEYRNEDPKDNIVNRRALSKFSKNLSGYKTMLRGMLGDNETWEEIQRHFPRMTLEQYNKFLENELEYTKRQSTWGKELADKNIGHHNRGCRGFEGKQPVWDKEDQAYINAGLEPPFAKYKDPLFRAYLRSRYHRELGGKCVTKPDVVVGVELVADAKVMALEKAVLMEQAAAESAGSSSQTSTGKVPWDTPFIRGLNTVKARPLLDKPHRVPGGGGRKLADYGLDVPASTKESRQAQKDREHEALLKKVADLETTMEQRVSAEVQQGSEASYGMVTPQDATAAPSPPPAGGPFEPDSQPDSQQGNALDIDQAPIDTFIAEMEGDGVSPYKPPADRTLKKKLFLSQETPEQEDPTAFTAPPRVGLTPRTLLGATTEGMKQNATPSCSKKKARKRKKSGDVAASKKVVNDKLPTPWRKMHHLGQPMLPAHIVQQVTPDMRSLHDAVLMKEDLLLRDRNPSYPVLTAKVPSGFGFVTTYPADLMFIRYEDIFRLLNMQQLDRNLVRLLSLSMAHGIAMENTADIAIMDPFYMTPTVVQNEQAFLAKYIKDFLVLNKDKKCFAIPYFREFKYCTLLLFHLYHSHVSYLDSGLDPDKDFTDLKSTLDKALSGFIAEVGIDKIRHEKKVKGCYVCNHITKFPCLKQSAHDNGMEAWFAILQMRSIVRSQNDLLLPSSLQRMFVNMADTTDENMTYYVVYHGRVPGVYEDWEDCRRQVHRFSGNSYKGYQGVSSISAINDEKRVLLIGNNDTCPRSPQVFLRFYNLSEQALPFPHFILASSSPSSIFTHNRCAAATASKSSPDPKKVKKKNSIAAASSVSGGATAKASSNPPKRGAPDAPPPAPVPPAPSSSTVGSNPGDWLASSITKRDENRARSLGLISPCEGNVILPAVEEARASPVKRPSGSFADEDDFFDLFRSAPAAVRLAQISTASSLSKGKDIPSAAAAATPSSGKPTFASQYTSLEADKARLQKEVKSSSSMLEGAIKIAAEARQEVDSLKEELEGLKKKLKDEEASRLAAEACAIEKDDLLRQSSLALFKATDIPAEDLDKLPDNSLVNALSMTLASHRLMQDLLQKGKGAMTRMHSMIFPKISQDKTLGQLIDAFAVNTKEVIEPPLRRRTPERRALRRTGSAGEIPPEGEIDAIVTVIELDIIAITIIIISTIITAVITAGHHHRRSNLAFADNLKYAHIDDKKIYPVIISSKLSEIEEERLLEILKKHRGAIGYTLDDLKGISPSICQHAINMEDDAKPVVEPQRRLIPKMKEVRCEETNLVLNWEKCHFMVNEGIVLGHKISERGIEVDRAKVEAIEKMPYPRDVKDRKGADNPVADNLSRLENIAYDPVPVNDSFPNEQLAVIKFRSTMVSKNKGKEFSDEDDRDLGWKEEDKDVKKEDEEEVEEDSRAHPRATIASIKVVDNPFSANKSARIRTGGAVPRHYLAPKTSPSGTHHPFHNLIFNNQIEGTPKAALPSQWDIDRSNTAGEKEPEAEEWGNNSKSWDSPSTDSLTASSTTQR
ncbi:hypothetical protein QYE76_039688 [Lolium multiflorum]|uniref:Ribonuclease H1 N-terminal domain-containing protein n=1 Tax=Lolium multiflorum TaxID=4521 RepID=A0AAD8WSD5_LOLMU|nr:hypothetical protein QYE76_039688 [Lolium multiflorum]